MNGQRFSGFTFAKSLIHVISNCICFDFSLPGLKVEITHCGSMKRKSRVIDVTKLSAQTLKFPLKQMETGQPSEITVARYFQEKHMRRLK